MEETMLLHAALWIDKVSVWLLTVSFMLPSPFHLRPDLHKQST